MGDARDARTQAGSEEQKGATDSMYMLRLFHHSRINFCHMAVMLIIVGLSGCQTTLQMTSTPTVPTLELTPTSAIGSAPTLETVLWQENWLKGIPCRPPCWEGITPGKTTASEVVQILKQIPYIIPESVTMGVSSLVPEIGDITWEWSGSRHDFGRALFDGNTPQQTVREIGLPFTRPIFLKDFIQIYGQPTQVVVRAGCNPVGKVTSTIQIVYELQGFWINTISPRDIKPDSWIMSINLFSPGLDNFAQLFLDYKSKPDLIVPWQGYQSFEFYCRDDDAGKACQGAK